jgi:putative ABC transport system substrate-binding protein
MLRAVDAQQVRHAYHIGLLTPNTPVLAERHFQPFLDGLRELGYVEQRNVVIERRYASGRLEQFPSLAAGLVRHPVDVIVAAGPHAIRAAQQATTTIPIVMAISHEPVAMGFVKSLSRPGGNITGLAFQDSELGTKRLELLREALPGLTRVAALWEKAGGGDAGLRAVRQAGASLGVSVSIVEVADAGAKRDTVQAVLQVASPLFSAHRATVSGLALQHRLPMSCETPAFVEAGCLMAYGPSFPDMWRRAAFYVDRVLKGTSPSDLPVEQPTRFELVINLKTAKALGLTIPPSLLARADQVIE